MEKTLTIRRGNRELFISDIDLDNEVEFQIDDWDIPLKSIWLDKENLISIKKHIDYLIKELGKNDSIPVGI